jgi:hypothetical protein
MKNRQSRFGRVIQSSSLTLIYSEELWITLNYEVKKRFHEFFRVFQSSSEQFSVNEKSSQSFWTCNSEFFTYSEELWITLKNFELLWRALNYSELRGKKAVDPSPARPFQTTSCNTIESTDETEGLSRGKHGCFICGIHHFQPEVYR